MNADQIRMTMKFMERVQLSGPEAPAYVVCMAALEAKLKELATPPAPPDVDSTPSPFKPPHKAPAVAP